jgi:hypothetical protein
VALAGARLAEARRAERVLLLVVLAVVSTLGYFGRDRVARWLDGERSARP